MKVVKVEGALVSGKTRSMSCPSPVIFAGEILAAASQHRLVGCSAGPGPVLVLGCSHHTVHCVLDLLLTTTGQDRWAVVSVSQHSHEETEARRWLRVAQPGSSRARLQSQVV